MAIHGNLKKYASLLGLAVVSGLYIGVRGWQLTAFDLWADELTTLDFVRLDWSRMMSLIIEDIVHPPLFYVLLKMWISIGGASLLWVRLFPVLISIASLLPLLMLCRELELKVSETVLALFLIALNGFLYYYAQELRMYSLLFLLTLWSLLFFLRFARGSGGWNRDVFALFIVNLLLVYTQYFGWLIVGTEFIYLLLWQRQKLRVFTLTSIFLVLCFAPWLFLVVESVILKKGLDANLGWIQRPSLLDLGWYYILLNGPLRLNQLTKALSFFSLVIFGLPVLWWMWQVFRKKGDPENDQNPALRFLLLFAVVPVVLAFLISFILPQSIWHPRYLIVASVPYLLLVSLGVNRFDSRRRAWARALAILLIAGWVILSGYEEQAYTDRISWRAAADRLVRAEPGEGVKVYAIGSYPIRYYLNQASEGRFKVVQIEDRRVVLDGDYAWDSGHFWLSVRIFGDRYRDRYSYQEVETEEDRQLEKIKNSLEVQGYNSGAGFVSGAPGYRLFLFPVDRGLSFNSGD